MMREGRSSGMEIGVKFEGGVDLDVVVVDDGKCDALEWEQG